MNIFKNAAETFDILYGPLIIPVFLFDGKGVLINTNRAFLDFIQSGPHDPQALNLKSFFKRFADGVSDLADIPENYVTEITRSDGKEIPVIVNYINLEKAAGPSGGGLIFITDLRGVDALEEKLTKIIMDSDPQNPQLVTELTEGLLREREKLQRDAQEAKAFLENVVESCGDGIIIADGGGTISYVNGSFAKIVNKKVAEITGHAFSALGPISGTFTSTAGEKITLDQSYVDGQVSNVEHIRQLEDRGKLENWLWYVLHKNGTIVPLEVTISVRRNAEGVITGSVSVLLDITERRIAEKTLREAYQFRSQFYTNITHEFRTPLTLAIGPMEEILRGEFGKVNSDIRQQLSTAMANSRQLLKLVNQLLDFSMLESGSKNLIYEKRDLNKFMSALLDCFASIAKRKKIKLRFTPALDLPHVSVDPVKLEKALFNIIGNAFKFTPEKGRITVAIDLENDKTLAPTPSEYIDARISITDTGIGIKKEDLAHIFDRFKRGGAGAGQKYGGTGIGLAHTKELIELMDGKITVTSKYGKGSTFRLHVPLATDRTDERPREELYLEPEIELSNIYREKDILTESISGNKPLILIVEDNPAVRKYISRIINSDYDYTEAHNGEQALKKMKQYRPDLILCDIMMPGMDGHELLRRIKSDQSLKNIAFIFLTAKANTEMQIEGLEEGADDYIVKPFNSLELLARVKALLRVRDLLSKTEAQAKAISSLTQKLQGKYCYGNIIGSSPPMRKIYQLLETIKTSDSTVLITGETGTGKELITNAIHYSSSRKDAPLVCVNCGAIPKELMEREFFGHIKGAYTGAVENRRGYFQEAEGGTLFLDEIGEMDKELQVKLLRVLERGELLRVGDSVPTKVDVRLIAASNKDLRSEIQNGTFREDLFYRIYVLPIQVPPLRQRSEDIPLLIEHFSKRLQSKQKIELPSFTEKDMRLFMSHPYPGNVRELENLIERFCLFGGNLANMFHNRPDKTGKRSTDSSYGELLLAANPLKLAGQKAKAKAEQDIIMQTLKICNNNHTKAAKKLKICRASLYRKLNKTD